MHVIDVGKDSGKCRATSSFLVIEDDHRLNI